jgi:hypothetical protein
MGTDEFLAQLPTCDEYYHRLLTEAKDSNEILCYVGHISSQDCRVGLKRYERSLFIWT